ncbi:unnamed protein product [Caenorhabditis auriculariae]|uniref:Uncharacterized protein n=1 Tax=Caenorhabditis auriculariae TaxID=2777116 RepID=A0A8S1HSZ1_9PELO|nr:unnamed protein product [Caenorhabditis auriculariae]
MVEPEARGISEVFKANVIPGANNTFQFDEFTGHKLLVYDSSHIRIFKNEVKKKKTPNDFVLEIPLASMQAYGFKDPHTIWLMLNEYSRLAKFNMTLVFFDLKSATAFLDILHWQYRKFNPTETNGKTREENGYVIYGHSTRKVTSPGANSMRFRRRSSGLAQEPIYVVRNRTYTKVRAPVKKKNLLGKVEQRMSTSV